MKRRMRVLIWLSAVLAVVACLGDEESREEHANETGAQARPVVVTATAPGWATETAWRLEEDLRLGVVDGGGPEEFGEIRSVVSDARGRIYVLEGMSEEIRVFDADGEFLHTIGRKGPGPGEFALAMDMMLGRGDTIWVVDPQSGRYSAFAPNGRFLTSHPRRILSANTSATTFLSDGRVLDWEMAFPDGRSGPRLRYWPLLVARDFGRLDSLPPLKFRREMMPDRRAHQLFFGGELLVAADREGGIWFAETREYRIYRRSLEGDTTTVLGLTVDPAPVGKAEREYVRREFGRTSLSRYLDDLPETKPIIHGIIPDNAGNVLVFPETAGAAAGTVVDVFRESGAYRGRLSLPIPPVPISRRAALTAYATSDHLLIAFVDALDVPHVARFNIIKKP